MKIAKGNLRYVIVFPFLGIAVKFPRIRLIAVILRVVRHAFFMRLGTIYREAFRISIDCTGIWGYKRLLFGGIRANWNEFLFFQKTKNLFCQPTYFSLLGLFNIQKFGFPCNLHWRTLAIQVEEITGGATRDDGHHFDKCKNFCLADGRLRLLDYGSKKTQRIIAEFGERIFKSFDPNWVEGKNKSQ